MNIKPFLDSIHDSPQYDVEKELRQSACTDDWSLAGANQQLLHRLALAVDCNQDHSMYQRTRDNLILDYIE